MKKRLTTLILALLMIVGAWGVCATAEVVPFPETPVIGIAWRADTDSEFFTNICRAVERTDKTFAVGLQFHPEAALVKHPDGTENQTNYMDYDAALTVFRAIVEALSALTEAA